MIDYNHYKHSPEPSARTVPSLKKPLTLFSALARDHDHRSCEKEPNTPFCAWTSSNPQQIKGERHPKNKQARWRNQALAGGWGILNLLNQENVFE
jgi:hypothetical protein